MYRVLGLIGLIVGTAAAVALAGGQTGAPPANDDQTLRQSAKAYAEALDRGDLAAIQAAWTPDADYIDEAGNTFKGREAIGKLFKQALPSLKANKTVYKLTAIRFIKPDVAVTDGDADITAADGSTDHSRFTAVWTKVGDQWLIASARDLPTAADPLAGDRRLKDLEWMVGDWTATDKTMTIKMVARWVMNRKFLKLEFAIAVPDAPPMLVVNYVGWDPTEGELRGWTFDSRGGFGNAAWIRDGATWMVDSSSVLPSGQTGSSTYVIKATGVEAFTWRATEREVDGQPLPDHELKYTKVAK